MVMPDIQDADAADEIEVPAPLDIPDMSALRARHDDGMSGDDTARHVVLAPRQKFAIGLCRIQHGGSPHVAD
jgi:hypothetical protein